jgi:hypothetical protein
MNETVLTLADSIADLEGTARPVRTETKPDNYASAQESIGVLREATADELWIEAQLDRLNPDRFEMGYAGDTDALVTLALELRAERDALQTDRNRLDDSPDPDGAYISRCDIESKKYDKDSFLAGYDQGSFDEQMRQGPPTEKPASEPLTDDKCREIYNDAMNLPDRTTLSVMRFIEREIKAHGIGGEV